jgi:glucose/arabinose dehydrogenase
LLDSNEDGTADLTVTLLSRLNAPNGIAWHKGSLYVAEISRVTRYDDVDLYVLANKVCITPHMTSSFTLSFPGAG